MSSFRIIVDCAEGVEVLLRPDDLETSLPCEQIVFIKKYAWGLVRVGMFDTRANVVDDY